MLTSASRQASQSRRPATRIPTVCVVDPKAHDYHGWLALAEGGRVRLQFVASAEEALRLARTAAVDLWVINAELPDRPGCELCEMLCLQSPRTPAYLVANVYTEQLERSAYRVGAKVFSVKPSHQDWLADSVAIHLRQLPGLSPESSIPTN